MTSQAIKFQADRLNTSLSCENIATNEISKSSLLKLEVQLQSAAYHNFTVIIPNNKKSNKIGSVH